MHGALPRERLFTLLDRAREQPVVWISGPPGAGKTTLVASYLEARKSTYVWYQLDASDADIGAFFHYLALAAKTSKQKWGAMPVPYAEVMSDPIAFGRGFFRELFAQADDELVLVLDNYQEVPENASLHTILRNAIEEIPESVQMLVVSRALPPNAYARHRAHGKIAAIGFDELKLTLDEATTVARQRGFNDAGAIGTVHGQTDGWFAGLILLIEHAARGGIAQLHRAESREGAFQYFAGEIFDAAPPEHQQTLMQTAFLPVMTAHTAERISANSNAHKLLEQLHQRQLFVERRSGDETTYQYHALFREFLQSRAREIFTPVGLRQLASRAAGLLREAGNAEQAVELLLEAQDWVTARAVILEIAPALFASSRWSTLGGWIARLPQADVESDGWLQFWQGAGYFAQQPLLADEQLGKAYANLEKASDHRGQMLTCSAVLRAYHSNIHGDFPSVGTWISRLTELVQYASALRPEESVEVHASLLMAFQYHDPTNAFRSECSKRLVALLLDQSVGLEHKGYAAGMAINYLVEDEQEAAQHVVEAVRPLLEKDAPQSIGDLYLWYYYTLYCQATGDFAAARRHIDRVTALADTLGTRRMAITSRWFQHINGIQERDIAALEAIRARILPKGDEGKAIHLVVFHSVTASILLLQGDSATAMQHLESWWRAAHADKMPLHEASGLTALAAAHLEHGDLARADALVQQGRRLAANSAMVSEYFELTLIGALASAAQGHHEQARTYLREVFAKGLPLFWGILLSPNNVLANAAALALKERIGVAAVTQMIKRYHLRAPSLDVSDWPWPLRIRTLGEFDIVREGEPLRGGRKLQRKPLELLKALIAFGCTNVDAQRLAEAVWSDLDGDAAMAAFHAALLRLRKLLGHDGLLQLQDGKLSLDISRCWVDTLAVESLFDRVDSDSSHAERLLDLYRGDFLAKEQDAPWLLPARERLRRRFLHGASVAGDWMEANGQWAQAAVLYERALASSNLSEEMYRRLMHCYSAQGRHAEAMDIYRRCKQLMSVVLNTQPSAETEAVYKQIRQTAN